MDYDSDSTAVQFLTTMTPIQCYKCCEFGHIATKNKVDGNKENVCTKQQTCTHCAGSHDYKQCTDKKDKSKAKCVNCAKHNESDRVTNKVNTNHSSRSPDCPVYQTPKAQDSQY